MSAAPHDRAARDGQREHQIALSRHQRERINAAAAALQRHARHDPDPLALLLAAAELRSIAQPQAAGAAEPAETELQRLKAALTRIADAESGIWGIIAKEALDGDTAPPAAVDVSWRR